MITRLTILIIILSTSLSGAWSRTSADSCNIDSGRLRAILVNGRTFIGPLDNSDLIKINLAFAAADTCTEALILCESHSRDQDTEIKSLHGINTRLKKIIEINASIEAEQNSRISDKDKAVKSLEVLVKSLQHKNKGFKAGVITGASFVAISVIIIPVALKYFVK